MPWNEGQTSQGSQFFASFFSPINQAFIQSTLLLVYERLLASRQENSHLSFYSLRDTLPSATHLLILSAVQLTAFVSKLWSQMMTSLESQLCHRPCDLNLVT